MRERLAASDAPDRIFTVTLEAARAAGLVGRRLVLDSTFLYDAVATMDTVTLLRSGIRGLLRVADADLESRVHAALARDDDYASSGKPVCAWDDAEAGKELVYALATDGPAALAVLEGLELEVVWYPRLGCCWRLCWARTLIASRGCSVLPGGWRGTG